MSHDPPCSCFGQGGVVGVGWLGGLAAVTLHRCHRMTGVLTYLARRCTTYESTRQDKMVPVFSLQAVMAAVRFLWVVRPTLEEEVVFWGEKMTYCRQWELNVLAALWMAWKPVSGSSVWSGRLWVSDSGFHLVMMSCQSSAPNQQPGAVNQTPAGRRSRVNVKKSVRTHEWK